MKSHTAKPTALFIPCLTEWVSPGPGQDMVTVLEKLGVALSYPTGQTCCGQIAYNSGYRAEAATLAERWVHLFAGADAVIAPSGSCVAMVRNHFGDLIADPGLRREWESLRERTYEFTQYLVHVLKLVRFPGKLERKVSWHDSCHLLRELGVKDEPRTLLRSIEGLELVDLPDSDYCCGFGGTFTVKFPELSGDMARAKCAAFRSTGADYLVAGDSSCLMHLSTYAEKAGETLPVKHIAEVLRESLG